MYWRGAKSAHHARRWWETLRSSMAEVDCEGVTQFLLRDDLDDLLATQTETAWPMHMLYRFDPLLLGHKDKHWIVPPAYHKAVFRPAGHIEGVILLKGQAAATWRYERKPSSLSISVQPFRKLTKTVHNQIARAASQIAAFFGTPLADLQIAAPGQALAHAKPSIYEEPS